MREIIENYVSELHNATDRSNNFMLKNCDLIEVAPVFKCYSQPESNLQKEPVKV